MCRLIGITLAEIYEKIQRPDAIVPYDQRHRGPKKTIPHNFETLHAKLRYIRPNSLRDNLCY